MSIGPAAGIVASAAGAPLAQTPATSAARAGQSAAQQRAQFSAKQVEKASGIGQTSQDEGCADRDADGRRFWETDAPTASDNVSDSSDSPLTKDASDDRGRQIDLIG